MGGKEEEMYETEKMMNVHLSDKRGKKC